MNRKNIVEAIESARKEAEENDAELDVKPEDFYDDDHLNCFWYGGLLGTLSFSNGWCVRIEVNGEVRLAGVIAGQEINYCNKNNSGAYLEDVRDIIPDDASLNAAVEAGDITFLNNNWVEYDFVAPDGTFHDLGFVSDNVLDDNVLDAFRDISAYAAQITAYANQESSPKGN